MLADSQSVNPLLAKFRNYFDGILKQTEALKNNANAHGMRPEKKKTIHEVRVQFVPDDLCPRGACSGLKRFFVGS